MIGGHILFRCDSHARTGWGHLSRCLSLAQALKQVDAELQVAFWGEFDADSRALIRAAGFAEHPGSEGGWEGEASGRLADACGGARALVLDGYSMGQDFVDRVRGRAGATAVIDDMHQLDLSAVDLVVCFRVGAEHRPYGARNEALGLDYLIVRPQLLPLRERNLARSAWQIHRCLVWLGGGDPDPALLELTVRAVAALGLQVDYVSREAISGPALPDVRRHEPDAQIERLYATADLVVCGGGLTKYESAYCGIPNACLSRTALQDLDTRLVAEADMTLDLGPASHRDPSRIQQRLRAFLHDSAAVESQRTAFRHRLRSDSVALLARKLLNVSWSG